MGHRHRHGPHGHGQLHGSGFEPCQYRGVSAVEFRHRLLTLASADRMLPAAVLRLAFLLTLVVVVLDNSQDVTWSVLVATAGVVEAAWTWVVHRQAFGRPFRSRSLHAVADSRHLTMLDGRISPLRVLGYLFVVALGWYPAVFLKDAPEWAASAAWVLAAGYSVVWLVDLLQDCSWMPARHNPLSFWAVGLLPLGVTASRVLAAHHARWLGDHNSWLVLLGTIMPLATWLVLANSYSLLRTAVEVNRQMLQLGRDELYQDLHGLLSGPVKRVRTLVRRDEHAAPDLVEAAESVPVLLHATSAMVDRDRWLSERHAAQVEAVVQHQVAAFGLTMVEHTFDLGDLSEEDHDRVLLCLANFLSNVAQEADRQASFDDPALLEVAVTGCHRDGAVVVAVADRFPQVPERAWLTTGTSLARLHDMLARAGGGLRQGPHPLGKIIEARWPVPAAVREKEQV